MNRHAHVVLELEPALEVVAGFAGSDLGREAVRSLRPSDLIPAIESELRLVEQAAAFLLRNEGWGVPRVPDLRTPLRQLGAVGSVWSGAALRDAGVLLDSARYVRRTVLRYASDYPRIAEALAGVVELADEEERLKRSIDGDGGVRDDASRELKRLRADVRAARSRIVEKLEQFVASLPEKVRVPDASVSVREGRYVVPVRREGRGEVGGIVHDESGTGATLFIEPPIAIELMNRIRELELAEAREVLRILGELTDLLRPHREGLTLTLEQLVALDSTMARARYSLEANGHRPELEPGSGYHVIDGRHPLLLASGVPVVPFSLTLEEGERTMLVSGPNTGGKTVLLKAIGLLSLLAQSGVVPPVGPGTRLPVFRDAFADIGDEQSIEASLSTFSAHLRNLRDVMEHADARSLVLIDEIGSGTDPAEGAALAQAILVELTRRGALTVATSHLGALKGLAGEFEGVVNASLQFDAEKLRPTYRLVKGMPGRSYGLAIARRLGFPEELITSAEAAMPQGERDANELLAELESKEKRLTEELHRAEAARRQTVTGLEETTRLQADLERQRKDAEKEAHRRAREMLLEARQQVEDAIRELRTATAEAESTTLDELARRARAAVEGAAREHAELGRGAQTRAGAPGRRGAEGIEVGARVRIAATGSIGAVVEIRDGRAIVETQGLRLQLDVGALEPVTPEEARALEKKAARAGTGSGWSAPEPQATTDIDLRGLRADEVAGRLEPAIDAAMRAELPFLRIIHGKGTGALREIVADMLESDPRVRAWRIGELGEGGTGVTVAEL
ncbi:MAG TPA: endonuclease MutS2 [Longimicrobiales bacterium]|nr:endonuclease MutS2 [Longimicrobiales bacterium]